MASNKSREDHLRKRAAALEAGNERSYKELKEEVEGISRKPFDMDTSDARREMLTDFLVQWGVITEEQRWEFEVAFHEKVETQLNSTWAEWRDVKQKIIEEQGKQSLAVVQKPTTLLDAHGKPIK